MLRSCNAILCSIIVARKEVCHVVFPVLFSVNQFFLSLSALASAVVSNTIPLDSGVYPGLEKLEGFGLVFSVMTGA